jgi:hypothetical protein
MPKHEIFIPKKKIIQNFHIIKLIHLTIYLAYFKLKTFNYKLHLHFLMD